MQFDEGVIPMRRETTSGVDTAGLGAEDWFLWSRIDGQTTIRALFRMSGQSRDATVQTLELLLNRGLIEIPGVEPTSTGKDDKKGEFDDLPEPNWFGDFERFQPDPFLMQAESALPVELRRLLLYYDTYREQVTFYDLLLVDENVDKRALSRAYHRLAKLFHPDRWFRQPLGALDEPLRDTFAWMSKAHRTLSSAKRRKEYDNVLQRGFVGPWKLTESSTTNPAQRFNRGESSGHSLGRNALVARGKRLLAEGKFRQAASCFQRALKLGWDANLAYDLAELQFNGQFDVELALATMRRISAKSPTNYAARLLEARILKSLGKRDDASRVLRGILREQPNHLGAKSELDKLGGSWARDGEQGDE